MLYITSPELIYLITGSLYLLTPFSFWSLFKVRLKMPLVLFLYSSNFSSKLWGLSKFQNWERCPTVGGCKEQDTVCGDMLCLSGSLSGPQPESPWTRPRWNSLTSWHSGRPFLCVRCEMCAVNHLTANQHALIGGRWVPSPCKITMGLDSLKEWGGRHARCRQRAPEGLLMAVNLQLALDSASHPLVWNKNF